MAERRQRAGTPALSKADAEDFRDAEDQEYDAGKTTPRTLLDKGLAVAILVSFFWIVYTARKLREEAYQSELCDKKTQDVVWQFQKMHLRVTELTNEERILEQRADQAKTELKGLENKKNVLQKEVQMLATRYMDLKKEKLDLLKQHEMSKKDIDLLAKEEEYLEKMLAETRHETNKTQTANALPGDAGVARTSMIVQQRRAV